MVRYGKGSEGQAQIQRIRQMFDDERVTRAQAIQSGRVTFAAHPYRKVMFLPSSIPAGPKLLKTPYFVHYDRAI